MKVLIVSESFANGGLETNIDTTVRSLKGKIEFFFALGKYNEKWKFDNVYTGFNFSASNSIHQFLEDVRNLTKIIQENNINVVHAQPFYSLFPAIFAAKLCNIPVVYTYHGIGSFNFPCYPNDTLMFDMLMDYEVDKIFSVSQEGKEIMENIVMNKNKVVYLPNSIDTEKFCKTKVAKNKTWALVSRLDDDKVKEIKKIIKILPEIDIECLHIYGDGSKREELEKLIQENNFNNKVYFKGHKDNLPEIFDATYRGVMGIGRVVMEAISMGFPTIIIGYNKISGVIDYEKYEAIKYENFVNKNLPEVSIEDLKNQIKNINNNYYDKRFYRLFKKEFSTTIISERYYNELKNLTNISILNIKEVYNDIQKIQSDNSFYNNNEVYNILKKHFSFFIRQPHQKNLIVMKDSLM